MNADPAHALAQLRSAFIGRSVRDRAAITEAMGAEEWQEVRRLSHGLAGLSGSFGFPEVGNAAYALEQTIDQHAGQAARISAWRVLDRLLAGISAGQELPES